MAGISPYRRCTGLTFSRLLRYAPASRKYVRPFRFPHASRAGDSLISTIKNRPSLRFGAIFYCGDGGNRTRVQSRFVGYFYDDIKLYPQSGLANVPKKVCKKHNCDLYVSGLGVRSSTTLHPSYYANTTVRIPAE